MFNSYGAKRLKTNAHVVYEFERKSFIEPHTQINDDRGGNLSRWDDFKCLFLIIKIVDAIDY